MPAPGKKFVATIPLSQRGKKRYVLFHLRVETSPKPNKPEVEQALNRHLLACYGNMGMPLHRYKFMLFDPASGNGIIRCAHTSKEPLIAALVSFSRFNGQKATLRTRKTSGTLKSLKSFFIPRAE